MADNMLLRPYPKKRQTNRQRRELNFLWNFSAQIEKLAAYNKTVKSRRQRQRERAAA